MGFHLTTILLLIVLAHNYPTRSSCSSRKLPEDSLESIKGKKKIEGGFSSDEGHRGSTSASGEKLNSPGFLRISNRRLKYVQRVQKSGSSSDRVDWYKTALAHELKMIPLTRLIERSNAPIEKFQFNPVEYDATLKLYKKMGSNISQKMDNDNDWLKGTALDESSKNEKKSKDDSKKMNNKKKKGRK